MRCTECGKAMRGYGVLAADAPGTVPRAGRDTCQACVNRRGGKPAEAPADDGPCVIVKANLRPSTYRAFADHAKELHCDVGDLLSRLADRAVRHDAPPQRPKATRTPRPVVIPEGYVEDDTDARIRELNAQGFNDTEIAARIGINQPSTSLRRRRLGLYSPGRRSAA